VEACKKKEDNRPLIMVSLLWATKRRGFPNVLVSKRQARATVYGGRRLPTLIFIAFIAEESHAEKLIAETRDVFGR
jgi:hypothetical protein